MDSNIYKRDFYGWTQQQAELLKSGRFSELDIECLAKEIEAIGLSKSNPLTKSGLDTVNNILHPLLGAAKERHKHMKKWWTRLYTWNCWLTGISVVLSGIAPFGLGLLLYTPQELAKTINLWLIILTAIGFIAQVWNVTQKNRERALHLRLIDSKLESAIINYESDIISIEEFALAFQEAAIQDAQEPAP